jgi:hypothetical protein
LGCLITVNGASVGGTDIVVQDTGDGGIFDSASATNLFRLTLAAGDVVGVRCATRPDDSGEALVLAKLLLEHVAS